MAKIVKCPNCGASDYEKTDDTHYRCNFCESGFVLEEKKRQTDVNEFLNKYRNNPAANAGQVPVKSIRAVMFGIVFFVMALGIGIAVFVNSTVQEAMESAPGKIEDDGYWGTSSVYKFYVYEGSKGPMIWILLNQSSNKLDSSKYTLQLIDPKKKEIVYERKYISMAWKESFNFGNYLSDMLCYNNDVFFLSDARGLHVYDLYSGKLKTDNEKFAVKFKELNAGLVYAKNRYYKDAIELMTNDGFKFNYLPKYDILATEEEFNDYRKGVGLIGGFVCSEGPRQKLYYIISEQDTLRNDFSFSEHYLTQYLRNGKTGQYKEKGFEVDPDKVFFNVKYFYRGKKQVVFAYTENVDKKSASYIVSYKFEDLQKPAWSIAFREIPGFENAMAEDFYLRTHFSEKELAIWYETAEKNAAGIDLKTGKINWTYKL